MYNLFILLKKDEGGKTESEDLKILFFLPRVYLCTAEYSLFILLNRKLGRLIVGIG